MEHWVNRRDIWGRYLAEKNRGQSNSGLAKNRAITAPFARERGKISLQRASLAKHFKAKSSSGLLGLHSQASNGTSRWFAIDIDYHTPDDHSFKRWGLIRC